MIVYEIYDTLPPGADPLEHVGTCGWCPKQGTWRVRHVGPQGELLGECLCDECENRLQAITEEATRRAYQVSLNSQIAGELYVEFMGEMDLEVVATADTQKLYNRIAIIRETVSDEHPLTTSEIRQLIQDYALYQTVLVVA